MAYTPRSIGRELNGDLFFTDDDGVAFKEGTSRFDELRTDFYAKKKAVCSEIHSWMSLNYRPHTIYDNLFKKGHELMEPSISYKNKFINDFLACWDK